MEVMTVMVAHVEDGNTTRPMVWLILEDESAVVAFFDTSLHRRHEANYQFTAGRGIAHLPTSPAHDWRLSVPHPPKLNEITTTTTTPRGRSPQK